MSKGSWPGSDSNRRRRSWLRRRASHSSRPHTNIRLELRELEPRRVLDAQGFLSGLTPFATLETSLTTPLDPMTLNSQGLATTAGAEASSLEMAGTGMPGLDATSSAVPPFATLLAIEPLAVEAQSIESLIVTAEFQIQLVDQQLVIDSLVSGRSDHLTVIFDPQFVTVRSGEFSEDAGTGVPRDPVQTLLVLPLSEFTGDVLVRTHSGDDSLIVSYIAPPFARNVQYEAGDGQDILYLEGASTPSTTVQITGPTSALVEVHGNRQIASESAETISSWIQSGEVAVQWSNENDQVELRDSRFTDRLEIVTSNAPDVFFNHPSRRTDLRTGGGNDTITVDGWGDQLRTEFRIDGQAGVDAILVNRSLNGSHVELELTAERSTVRESIEVGQLVILGDELVIGSRPGNTGNHVVRLSTEKSTNSSAAELTVEGSLRLESNLELIADGRLSIGGPIDSQAHTFRSLFIQSSDSGVSLGDSIGDGAADGSLALGRIQIHSLGTIAWPEDMVFRTQNGSVSHLPLQLQVGPKDPTRPFGGDQQRVQQLAGLAGGSDQIQKDFAGENLVLTIHWDDGHTSSFAVSGGEQVTLVSMTGQADQWTAVPVPVTPVVFAELGHQYTIDYLVSVVEQGRKFVEAQLELTSDSSIQIIGRPTPEVAPIDLISVNTTVRSSVTVGQILFALQPVAFEPPTALVDSEPVLLLQEIRPAAPQLTQVNDQASGVEVNSNAARELIIVTVGPDGEEVQSYPLPPEALLNLQGLLQRFIDEGLPNGRYRIYLREVGFPVRRILEFYKSGTTIGNPVRELGPGSNPLRNTEAVEPTRNSAHPPVDRPLDESAMSSDSSDNAGSREPTNAISLTQPSNQASIPTHSTSASLSPFSAGARWRRRLSSSSI